jgi:hypothetical protein
MAGCIRSGQRESPGWAVASDRWLLADHILRVRHDQRLADWLTTRRAAGASLARIAADLAAVTGVSVTRQTVATWLRELQ